MPCDLDFGSVLGSIWGPFWEHFGVKNRFESDWKKNMKKVTQTTQGRAKGLACGPLKETSQTGDWQLETGNWQDWGLADLFRLRNTPLRALRGARWRILGKYFMGGKHPANCQKAAVK